MSEYEWWMDPDNIRSSVKTAKVFEVLEEMHNGNVKWFRQPSGIKLTRDEERILKILLIAGEPIKLFDSPIPNGSDLGYEKRGYADFGIFEFFAMDVGKMGKDEKYFPVDHEKNVNRIMRAINNLEARGLIEMKREEGMDISGSTIQETEKGFFAYNGHDRISSEDAAIIEDFTIRMRNTILADSIYWDDNGQCHLKKRRSDEFVRMPDLDMPDKKELKKFQNSIKKMKTKNQRKKEKRKARRRGGEG